MFRTLRALCHAAARRTRPSKKAARRSRQMWVPAEVLEDRTLLSAGELDPTFGVGGKLTLDLGASDIPEDVTVTQPDGRILVAGRVTPGGGTVVVRYHEDGSIDDSFGIGGVLRLGGPSGPNVSVDVDSQNRIVVSTANTIWRLTNSGILDTTFGAGGVKTIPIGGVSMAVDSQDRPVIAASQNGDFVVVRLTEFGDLDLNFDGDGFQSIDFGSTSDSARSIAVDSADRIVVGGQTNAGFPTGLDFAVARLAQSGSLDWIRTVDFDTSVEFGWAVAVDGTDNVFIAGDSRQGSPTGADFALAKFSPAGELQWKQTLDFDGRSDGVVRSLAIDSQERVIIAGVSSAGSFPPGDFALARYTPSGDLEWKQRIDFGDTHDGARSVTADSKNRIVVVGLTRPAGTSILDFAIARLLGGPFNESPIADADGPYVGVEGTPFQLDGTGSSDPDDVFADLTFEWDLNYDGMTFDVDKTGAQPSVTFDDDVATRTIALRVTDPKGESHIATTTLRVDNAPPTVADPVVASTNEDTATLVVDLLDGADDPGTLDVLSVANLTHSGGDASGVTVVGNSLSIDPAAYNHLAVGQSEVISYSFNVVDDDGGSVAQTATITIEGRNDAPTGADFAKTGTEDSPVGFSTADFAAGFSDPDNGDTLVEVRIDSLPANGTLLLNGTAVTAGQVVAAADLGNLVFVPDLNFHDVTSFAYSVGDGHAFAATPATVTLDIFSANDQANLIFGQINTLLAAGTITSGQAEALSFMLKDNNGDAGKVQAFLNEVQAYINAGILSAEQAEDLLSSGNLLLISVSTA